MKAVILLLLVAQVHCRLSDHFIKWLNDNGYGEYGFARDDYGGLSFGGKKDDADWAVNQPVVFVHGTTGNASNWDTTREYLISQGYKSSEIYATTWGVPKFSALETNHPDKNNVMYVRKFIEAVIAYTGAKKIDVIAHSMGVTISRTVIRGGTQWDHGTYNIGEPLTSIVDTYVGIAGFNRGGLFCLTNPETPVCDTRKGFFPGILLGTKVIGRSELLESLLREPGFEGKYVYSIYSLQDPAIPNRNIVHCERTSRIPGQTDEIVFDAPEYTHEGVILLTAKLQHSLIKYHKVT